MTDDEKGKIPSDVEHATSEGSSEGKQNSAVPTEDKPADNLPEDTSDRTKEQFDKLLKNNKDLSEKLKKYEEGDKKSVYDSLHPERTSENSTPDVSQFSNLSKKEVAEVKDSLIDSDGYVDPVRLENSLKQANERAKQAEMRAKSAEERFQRFEENQQLREAYEKFPHLNPYDKNYDANFYRLVKNELTSQMMQGKKDLLSACKDISEIYNPKTGEKTIDKKEAEKKKQEQVDQINATSPKASVDVAELSYSDLRDRTIKGDGEALSERLRRAGY